MFISEKIKLVLSEYWVIFMDESNKNEIDELFYQLKLPKRSIKPKSFEVWEVPPIKKDMRLYSSSD